MIEVEPPVASELAQLWEQALSQLSLQMSRATFFNWLQPTRLVGVEDEVYLVEAGSRPGQEWLDRRLRPLVERTLAGLVGRPVGLRFVVGFTGVEERRAGEESTPAEAQWVDLPPEARVDLSSGELAGKVDFDGLWRKTGFTATPDYAIRYWRLYLGRAFDLWELLVSEDKRDVKRMRQGELPYWTPVKQYSYHILARLLRCSRNTLTGHLQPCWDYRRQTQGARANGERPPEVSCCGRFNPGPSCFDPAGQLRCVYWCEGLLERLSREGLIAAERVRPPQKPRAHVLRLQAWRLLPILTPTQVASFKEALDQEHHRQWLERYSHLGSFNPAQWDQMELPSLVPLLPGYGQGRQLLGLYRNNPLGTEAEG